jgi:DoxX-like family
MRKLRKMDTAIYRTATGLVCAVMAFSAVNFNLAHPFGPFERPFAHLGFPDYFRIELTTAKVLGVVALLAPGVPRRVKEFAYFGFAITLVSASFAHYSSGDGVMFVVDPLLFLGALAVSYRYFSMGGPEPEPWRFRGVATETVYRPGRGGSMQRERR